MLALTFRVQSPADFATEFISANGLTFEVLTHGQGDTLALCLHGFPEVALSWREQLPALLEFHLRVWAPNQRGYGRTTRPPNMQDYSIELLMDDITALIDASRASRVILVGHDWGGIVAWCFAARKLRPLAGLVILNAPHPACFARALRRPGQMLRSWYAAAFQLPKIPELVLSRNGAKPISDLILRTSTAPASFPQLLLTASRENAAQPGALTAMLNWYRAFLRGGFRRQLRAGFPAIEAPTLFLWGEHDAALAKYTTYGTEQYVRNLRTVYFPRVSHWLQQDGTEAVNAEIRNFLRQIL
jgi:epoxide hydrolase 4